MGSVARIRQKLVKINFTNEMSQNLRKRPVNYHSSYGNYFQLPTRLFDIDFGIIQIDFDTQTTLSLYLFYIKDN